MRPPALLLIALLLAAAPARAADSLAVAPPAGTPGSAAPPAENLFPVVLGSFSTTLVGSLPERTHNVRLAAAALDGLVLEPGQVLSFNRSVGPRTVERGYLRAPVILREARQFQLGGGICQVSSTAFAAAMISGLAALERHRHSSPVDYIELGQDATVSWGLKDLRVQNVLDQRVRVRVEVLGSTLTVRFEGEEETGAVYELVSDAHELADESGQSAPGREIEVYRVRRVNGAEAERELLHRDVYPAARVRPSDEAR